MTWLRIMTPGIQSRSAYQSDLWSGTRHTVFAPFVIDAKPALPEVALDLADVIGKGVQAIDVFADQMAIDRLTVKLGPVGWSPHPVLRHLEPGASDVKRAWP